jgi:ABC-type siderophore export system fused ATPase/permease subunit
MTKEQASKALFRRAIFETVQQVQKAFGKHVQKLIHDDHFSSMA